MVAVLSVIAAARGDDTNGAVRPPVAADPKQDAAPGWLVGGGEPSGAPATVADPEASCGPASSGPLSCCASCGEAWMSHPITFGLFAGIVDGSPLMDDWVGLKDGANGGLRLGWEVDPHWAAETRLSLGTMGLYDSEDAKSSRALSDLLAGRMKDPTLDHRSAGLIQCDVDFLFYLSDARCRPYLIAGVGMTNLRFTDRFYTHESLVNFSMPLGVGVKYLWTDSLALRLDCVDDVLLGNLNIDTVNNVSLTAGIEFRFGGSHRMYWPWDPGR